jgi:hypothetical protein
MKVRTGWATEFARVKFDVEVEQQDLDLMLEAEDLSPGQVTVRERFMLMKSEADVLSAAAMHGHYPDAAEKFRAATAARDKVLADIYTRLFGNPEAV